MSSNQFNSLPIPEEELVERGEADNIAIRVSNLSKCYQIYDTPRDRLKQFVMPRLQTMVGQLPKQYFREFWALKDVSFEIKKGEAVGIIGRNGSGKSTLLQIICGTLSPTSGAVETNGRIAALLELGSGFNPEFTGRENVYVNGAVLGLTKDEIDARFDDIAAFAEIGEFIEQPVKTYSSGMVVRLAFAVSVSVSPDILIVDEALAVGDMAFQQKCFQRLADLREQGTTILLVTHDIMLTRNYCGRVVYLDCGIVKRIGDPESVGELYVKDLFSERQNTRDGHGVEWREGTGTGRIGFGSSRGRIASVRVTNNHSSGTLFQQGEQIFVVVQAETAVDVKNPEFVFQLRDFRGYVLYGISSKPTDLEVTFGPTYMVISAQLSFSVDLGAGNYAISLGLVERQGDALFSVLDKVVGIAEFSVADNAKDKFHGCVNLHGRWEGPTYMEFPKESECISNYTGPTN
jgi:lipopolysaccharide transport system ATP-binding protein